MSRPVAIMLAVLLPMALAVLVAWPGRSSGWARADIAAVVQNPLVTEAASPAAIIRASDWRGRWEPLAVVTLGWDWRRGNHEPVAFHDTNLMLGAIAAGLLAVLALAMGLRPAIASAAACMFAAHAARVDAVIGIDGRASLCGVVLTLAALVVAASRLGAWRHLVVGVLAVAVWLCGSFGFVLLLVLPARSKRDVLLGRVIVVTAAVFWMWACGQLGSSGHALPPVEPGHHAAELLAALGSAAAQIVWPSIVLLVADDTRILTPTAGWLALGGILAASPFLVFLLSRRRLGKEAWALLLMVASFLVMAMDWRGASALLGTSMLSLPIAGAALALGAAANRIALRRSAMPPPAGAGQRLLIATALLALVALALAARSIERARDWQSPHQLALAQLRDAPQMGISHEMLARDMLETAAPAVRPDGTDSGVPPDEVLKLLAEAVRLDPRRTDALVMLARSRLRQAQALPAGAERVAAFGVAEALYRRAVVAAPAARDVNGPLGLICLMTGREPEGEKYLRAELAANPLDPRAVANLTMYLDGKDRHDEARALAETQLAAAQAEVAAHPENLEVTRFAAALAARLGRTEQATALYETAVREARSAEAIGETVRDLSRHLVSSGKSEQARAAMIEAIARLEKLLPAAESPAVVWFVLSRIEVERTNFIRGRECLVEAQKLATGPLRTLVDDTLKRLDERDKRDR